MNTNKKHKSKNKPNKSSNPTEKSDVFMVEELQLRENEEKVASEGKNQVKAIVECEVGNDEKNLEPKKPKRNKNKKKNSQNEDHTEVDSNEISIKPTESNIMKENENVNVIENVQNEPLIAPTATRKKNKNKQKGQDMATISPNSMKIKSTEDKEKQDLTYNADETLPMPITEEADTKVQKKKNKKKKRHDSERSEKSEETFSCTTAFEKLLECKIDTDKDLFKEMKTADPVIEKKVEEIMTKTADQTSKSKKNKKNKNKMDESNIIPGVPSQEPTEAVLLEATSDCVLEGNKEITVELTKTDTVVKPKAQIAKPVNKKRGNKIESPSSESTSLIASSETEKLSTESELEKPVCLGDILFQKKKLRVDAVIENLPEQNVVRQDTKGNKGKEAPQKQETQKSVMTELEPKILKTFDSSEYDDDDFIIPSLLDITDDETKTERDTSIVLEMPCEKVEAKQIIETPVSEPVIQSSTEKINKSELLDELQVPSTKQKKRNKSPKLLRQAENEQEKKVLIKEEENINVNFPKHDRKDCQISDDKKNKDEKDQSENKFPVPVIQSSTEIINKSELHDELQVPCTKQKKRNKSPKSLALAEIEQEKKVMIKQEENMNVNILKHDMKDCQISDDKKNKDEKDQSENKFPIPVIQSSTEIINKSELLDELQVPCTKQKKRNKSPKPLALAEIEQEKKVIIKQEENMNINILKHDMRDCQISNDKKNKDEKDQSENKFPVPVIQSSTEIINKSELLDELQIPSTKQKKRNKSPKPLALAEIEQEKKVIIKEEENMDVNILKHDMKDCQISDDKKIKDEKDQSENKFPVPAIQSSTEIINKSELLDELQVPSTKQKKRKKSPKPFVQAEIQEEKKVIIDEEKIMNVNILKQDIKDCQISDDKKNIDKKDQRENKFPAEITPDLIQYPRSTSHETTDSNSGTFIKEIPHEMNIAHEISKTPLVKGSGETPESPTKMKLSEFEVIEIESDPVTSIKEKTDLKSKMMEVNKDMEDLRLSIERSLAELTSLDKDDKSLEKKENKASQETEKGLEQVSLTPEKVAILPPPRQDNKGKGKSKKKNKSEGLQNIQGISTTPSQGSSQLTEQSVTESKKAEDNKGSKTESSDQKSDATKEKTKQQSDKVETQNATTTFSPASYGNIYNKSSIIYKKERMNEDFTNGVDKSTELSSNFEPIVNFDDAMTSSLDDVNKTFEMIANESNDDLSNNPQISVTAPVENENTKRDEKAKTNPVSQPKNLLGHHDIPVQSNKSDYKKEKNKPPNARQARVKIKDCVEIEAKSKQSKECQTENKKAVLKKDTTVEESVTCVTNENEEYVYKYSFRRVFLPNICHICKKELKAIRVPCNFCSLVFYCSNKHKDEGWPQHQALCFAVSTVAHHKNQKHIYADVKGLSGQDFRLFRMQLIVACEKVLKRRLVPWEQEAILYPRICADLNCREYCQGKLKDCEGCSQISYCADHPDHLPKNHQKWCKSYALYQKLVHYQQTEGRLAPKLPTRVLTQTSPLPDKINMVLATLYEEKIDMNDIQYAALTQLATAPLTAAYSYQLYSKMSAADKIDKSLFTIHIVNAELQYEADALNKWECLFLHLLPNVNELRVVLTGSELNPGGLPLELLGKVKLCANCRLHTRRLSFVFQDKKTYAEYWDSNDFITPDIVCAFNPSIQRSTLLNGKDSWPMIINTILKLKSPFLITSFTMNELKRDLNRIKECSKIDYKVVSEAKFNPFASVRPDRNFITDDEIPLLFKNYCFAVLCGV